MSSRKRKNTAEPAQNMKLSAVATISHKLNRQFFNVPSYELANLLLGKLLIRKTDNGDVLKGRIIETECYPGGEDKASVTFGNRRTPANEPLYMQSGTAFIYMTYGMYHCFNISSLEEGGGVLLRAIEPIQGVDTMQDLRQKKRKGKSKKALKEHELCNGPSKLCMSMDIKKDNFNKLDLCENDALWIENDCEFSNDFKTVKTARVGIDLAGPEWAKKPFRFYILGNACVSKRDVKAENLLDLS